MNSQVRFAETPDGWLDAQTGLEWGKTIGKFSWEEACAAVPKGWRLPTIAELATIVDWSIYSPATELPDTQSNYYWSATTYQVIPTNAWIVNFYDGFVSADGKTFNDYVRAVRAGL